MGYIECSICWKYLKGVPPSSSTPSIADIVNIKLYRKYVQKEYEVSPESSSQKKSFRIEDRDNNSNCVCSKCTESCKKILYVKGIISEFEKELDEVINSFRNEVEQVRKKKLNSSLQHKATDRSGGNKKTVEEVHYFSDENLSVPENEFSGGFIDASDDEDLQDSFGAELDATEVKEEYVSCDVICSASNSRKSIAERKSSKTQHLFTLGSVPDRLKLKNIRDVRIKVDRMPMPVTVSKTSKQQFPETAEALPKRKAAIKATAFLQHYTNENNVIQDKTKIVDRDFDVPSEQSYSEDDEEVQAPTFVPKIKSNKTVLKCADCQLSFRSPFFLKLHRIMHTNEYEFSCNILNCGKKFKSTEELKKHQEKHKEPNNLEVHKCETCGDAYEPTTFPILEAHSRTHQVDNPLQDENEFRYKCDACQLTFTKIQYYKHHLMSHPLELDSSPYCPVCKQKFTLTDKLMALHMETHKSKNSVKKQETSDKHPLVSGIQINKRINEKLQDQTDNSEDYDVSPPKLGDDPKCIPCGLTFEKFSFLIRHLQSDHNGSKNHFCCPECGKKFALSSVTNYKSHMRKHTGEHPYKCTDCELSFITLLNHKVHRIIHTNRYEYSCDISSCRKRFKTVEDLAIHQENENHKDPNEFEVYTCEVCGDCYEPTVKRVYEVHMRTEHKGFKAFQCTFEDCGKRFSTDFQRKEHGEQFHLKTKEFPCKTCNKMFYTSSFLRNHAQVHLDNAFMCEVCGRDLKLKSGLKRHMLTHHQNYNRKYKCQVCQTTFADSSELSRHIKLTHKKIRNFACNTCDKRFSRSSSLNDHVRSHTGERLECNVCGKKFKQQRSFDKHMKMHNNNDVEVVEIS